MTAQPIYFVTFTAPSQVGRHRMGRSGEWCPCTPEGGIFIAEWNARCGQNFSWLIEDLRRTFDRDLQYFRVAEAQRRGAIHFHCLIRCCVNLVDAATEIRRLAMKWSFGHSTDVRLAIEADRFYVAKYASKSAADRVEVPWLDLKTGEVIIGHPRLRLWTASRGWGLTMAQLKSDQAEWARQQAVVEASASAAGCSETAGGGDFATPHGAPATSRSTAEAAPEAPPS